MQSASKHLGNQISHRMGNYELQYKTMNGRAVYRKYSETWGSAFLYYDFVSSTKKYWVIGADLGTPDVNLYAPSGVVDATQVRSASMHTSQTLTLSCADWALVARRGPGASQVCCKPEHLTGLQANNRWFLGWRERGQQRQRWSC